MHNLKEVIPATDPDRRQRATTGIVQAGVFTDCAASLASASLHAAQTPPHPAVPIAGQIQKIHSAQPVTSRFGLLGLSGA